MKLELFNTEANKIWQHLSHKGEITANQLQLELDLYKKLLVFFQIGESCYFIFNFHTLEFDFVSAESLSLFGYGPEEITAEQYMQQIHPSDRGWFLNCQNAAGKFILTQPAEKQIKYKMRFDYRIAKKSGDYIWVMQQVVVAQNDVNGSILRSLIVITDISHLKSSGRPIMSYIGMDGEPSFIDVEVKDSFHIKSESLGKREKEVLNLLAQGKPSKEIADILHVSKHTVDTHRKNMLRKGGCANTSELVNKAIRDGWI